MATTTTQIMDFVKKFLEENHCTDIVDEWMGHSSDIDKMVKKASKKTTKASSSPKDPNKPKRGRSSYIYFCGEKRAEIKESMDEDSKPADVMREMGARWRALKESTKKSDKEDIKRYEEMAAKDKERHAQEMDTYVPMSDEDIAALKPAKKGRKKSTTTKAKDPSKPKRARSAYIFFGMEKRSVLKEENPDADSKEITSLLGELWSRYKEEEEFADEVERFKEMAAEDKERYTTEMENLPEEVKVEKKVQVKKKPQKVIEVVEVVEEEKEEDDDATQIADEEVVEEEIEEEVKEEEVVVEAPKPKRSSPKKNQLYINYCKSMRQDFKDENPDASSLQITKMLGESWKKMDEEEKAEWA